MKSSQGGFSFTGRVRDLPGSFFAAAWEKSE